MDVSTDPLEAFRAWLGEAAQLEPNDPNAMSLATVGTDGMPSVRVLLLKDVDDHGFVFYTNQLSRKGRELAFSKRAALCFHWKSLRRQVRVCGDVSVVDEAESDAYFATRPRGSQIGAHASLQSEPLEARNVLEERVKEFDRRYEGVTVPRPKHWGGYRLIPQEIEFWQDREFRLHDRFRYTRTQQGEWQVQRLYP